jgi:hypothetical protein
MVFGDYEFIHTKRVVRQRQGMNIWVHRQWKNFGGYNTVFLMATSGYLGYSLKGLSGKLCSY